MKKITILACILSFAGLLHAQEAPAAETAVSDEPFNQVTIWDFVFGIGYNYRKFHKVKLFKGSDVATYYVPGTLRKKSPLTAPCCCLFRKVSP